MDQESSGPSHSATKEAAREKRIARHLDGRTAAIAKRWLSGHKVSVIVGTIAPCLLYGVGWLCGVYGATDGERRFDPIKSAAFALGSSLIVWWLLQRHAKFHGLKCAHSEIVMSQEDAITSLRDRLEQAENDKQRLEDAVEHARSLPTRALEASCKQLRAFAALYKEAFYYASGQFGYEDADCDRSAVRDKSELDKIAQEYIGPVLGEMHAQDFDYYITIPATASSVSDVLSQPHRDHLLSTLQSQAEWMRRREQDLTCERIEDFEAAINLARPLEQLRGHLELLR